MRDPVLMGTESVERAANTIRAAVEHMASVAAQLEDTFIRRRQWEEEYLQRIEALVEKELEALRCAEPGTVAPPPIGN